jgi:hypothetical protein
MPKAYLPAIFFIILVFLFISTALGQAPESQAALNAGLVLSPALKRL